MKTTLAMLLLLLPGIAFAADQCCFKGPGKCSVINSESDKTACEKLPFFVVLESSCHDASECMLSEEEPVKRSENAPRTLWRRVTAK